MYRLWIIIAICAFLPVILQLAAANPDAIIPGAIVSILVVLGGVGLAFRGNAGLNPAVVIVFGACAVGLLFGGAVWMSQWGLGVMLPIVGGLSLLSIGASYLFRGRKLARERAAAGCCDKCGYDLRESFELCPECGAEIPEEIARWRRWRVKIAQRRAVERGPASQQPS